MSETQTSPKPADGWRRGNRNAAKSGHYALKESLKSDGFSVLTRRQRETVRSWRAAIESDAGGREQLSELKRMQLERYLVTEVLIQSIDAWLLQQKTIIAGGRKLSDKRLIPVVVERNRLAETSLKLAQVLGLERRQPPTMTLQQYLALREQQDAGAGGK
jgi:hypothetical protein